MSYWLIAAVAALLLSLLGLYIEMPILNRLRVGQTINELGPQTHKDKQGMLTMGGVSFLCAGLIAAMIFGWRYKNTNGQLMLFAALSTVLFGAIGFADDYLKVARHKNEGLTVKQKFIPQCAAALVLAIIAFFSDCIGPAIDLPFTKARLNLGILYIPLAVFVMVAVDNSANILDGLDGLLASNSSIAFAAMSAYTLYTGIRTENGSLMNLGIFCLCMCFAVIGFLRRNTNPASIMMGDVGSLGIGGALAGAAIASGGMLLLPFALIMMVVSSLSDILQVVYMRRHKGRKLLRMSPLHHHLELGGMKEAQIVSLYSIITLIGCAAALILFA